MGKTWTYKYGENTIIVKNKSAVQLYIDDRLQDEKNGLAFSVDLSGKLAGGEEVKASLGGIFSIKCSLFIDNVLQTPVEVR